MFFRRVHTFNRIVNSIEQYLYQQLQLPEVGGAQEPPLPTMLGDLEQLLQGYCPVELALAITAATQQATAALQHDTANLDLQRDAKTLQFEPGQEGGFVDKAANTDSGSILKPVEELLCQGGACLGRQWSSESDVA